MSGQVIWTALVGLAGIAGSVVTAHLTNQAAERRLRLEQEEADRTRFHNLRVDLYGKLFGGVIALRVAIAETRPRFHELTEEQIPEFVDSFNPQFAAIVSIAQMVEIISLEPTRARAKIVLDSVLDLQLHSWADGATYKKALNQLDAALAAFSEAARTELLPPKSAQATR